MKNILVPIDFSEHSNYAVEVAVDLAKKNGATILLFHKSDINCICFFITNTYFALS